MPMSYSRTQKMLHWAIAALVAAQFLLFDGIGRAFATGMRSGSFAWSGEVVGHIATGLGILALMLWRLGLRLRRGAPPPPAEEPALARLAASAAHGAFYALLLAMPLSGLAAWFLQLGPAGSAHEAAKSALLLLIALHVAAVAVHQVFWRTGLLSRMT